MFPFDFDSRLSLRIPYKETLKLDTFFDKHNLPFDIVGSGGKGFHFYFNFEEVQVSDVTDSKIFSIQYALKKYFNLNSVDEPLLGKKSLMIRIPQTPYVAIRKENKQSFIFKNGNYCRWIPSEEFRKGLSHVEKMLKEPGELPPKRKTKITLQEIIEIIPDYKFKEKFNGSLNLDLNPGGILVPTVNSVGLPCLIAIAKDPCPSHDKRIELVAWLKVQGYRNMSIVSFIRNLGWKDFNFRETTNNVSTVKPRFPKCSTLNDDYCETCGLRK